MGNRAFALLVLLGVAAAIAYPCWQAAHTGGWIYYQNGYDETTYLSYRFSLVAQALTRPGSALVTLLHRLGVPGGWQNLLFDASAVAAFPLLVRAAWRAWTGDGRAANLAAATLAFLPLACLTIDPPVRALFQANLDAWTLAWVNVPELHTPPLVRTPEPQVSLVLLAAAVWLAVARARASWPVYAVLPFLYPFVSIPAAFVVLALDLRKRLPAPAALGGAALAVAVGCAGYFHFLVGPKMAPLLLAGHLPLISFTGTLALAALALSWRAIEHRFLATAAALAPWVACNQQVLSGHMGQPDNFEQYFGCFAVALVVALAARGRWRWLPALVGLVFYLRASQVVFATNAATNARLPLTPALLSALEADPGTVAINDMVLASLVGMLHARQAPTALAMEGSFYALEPGGYVGRYRCAKRRIQREHPDDAGFRRALGFLDAAYMYGGQDFKLNHINRRPTAVILQDVDAARCDGDGPALRYFFAR